MKARDLAASLLAFVSWGFALEAQDDAWAKYETKCRDLMDRLDAGKYAEVEAMFDASMKEAVPEPRLAAVMDPLRAQMGRFSRFESHRLVSVPGHPELAHFELICRFEKSERLLKMTVAFNGEGKIAGLQFQPAEEKQVPGSMPFADYRCRTKLVFPFAGEWTVVNGGRTLEVNPHVANQNQRYACDFSVTDEKGKSFRTDGKTNADYYAYGKEVLAPGEGTVIQVVDGVEDNELGKTNLYFVPGNLVVIDHGHAEHSFLAHFQPGSIRVKVGQKVRRGEVLGRCGNSGNSSEPHIHYHLANAPLMQEGDGLPVTFRNFRKNGEPVEAGEPARNDRVRNGSGAGPR